MRSSLSLGAAWTLSIAALVSSQSTAPALNSYIGLVQSAASVVKSANSREAASATSSSSSPPPSSPAAATSSPTATPPPAHHGSNHKTLIIAVVCAVVGAILIGLILLALCCLFRRRKRRNRQIRTPSPIPEREPKTWKVHQPNNPGRNYTPLASQNQAPSMTQEPTVPLATHHGGPMIEQHPAYRPENPFVPVPPNPRRTHHQVSPSYGTDATIAPYAAMTTDPEKQPLAARSRSNSPYRPSTGSSGLPTHAGPDRPPTPFGLMGAGAAGATVGAAGVAAAKHHDHHNESAMAQRHSQEPVNPTALGSQPINVPTSQTHKPSGYTGPTGLNQHRLSGQQPYSPQGVNAPVSQPVRSQPVAASTGPTAASRADRHSGTGQPYTSIGEPYNDMHVHVLQNSAPSRTLQHSPPAVGTTNPTTATNASRTSLPGPYSAPYVPPPPVGASIPCFSTPPEAPPRSPRRSMQQNNFDSSHEGEQYDSTTASSSENGWQPSYAPAVPTEHSSSPHSSTQHHTPRSSNGTNNTYPRSSGGHNVHFSNSPTTATNPVGPPPPVPWETEGRRYSPQGSPRASGTYERRSGPFERSRRESQGNNGYGRRTSHSPATSINGQPRRLRFSDLQATEQSRDWETQRFNGGVGEAL